MIAKKDLPMNGSCLIYEFDERQRKQDVRTESESLWQTQLIVAIFFQTSILNNNTYLQYFYKKGELIPDATAKKYLTVRQMGSCQVQHELDYYNPDKIISVENQTKGLSHEKFFFEIFKPRPLIYRNIIPAHFYHIEYTNLFRRCSFSKSGHSAASPG